MSFLKGPKHPSGGERLDDASQKAIRLAHTVLERFPEVVNRHRVISGGVAVSSALLVLTAVAIRRRMHNGESVEEAVENVTEQELEGQFPS